MSSWKPLDPGQGLLGLGRHRPQPPRPAPPPDAAPAPTRGVMDRLDELLPPRAPRPPLRLVPQPPGSTPPPAPRPPPEDIVFTDDVATAPTIPAPPARRAPRPRTTATRAGTSPETHRGLVLCAAGLLADGTARDVAIEDLVVRAWELAPEAFGLRGHPHPDSNRVVSKIYGAQSLLGLHLLTAGGAPRSVALTPAGVAWWRSIGRPWLEGRAR